MKDIDLNKLKELAMPFSARDWFVNKDEEVVSTDHEVGPDGSGEIFVACANAIETARFISAANPATIIALIERLEAADRQRDGLQKQIGDLEENLRRERIYVRDLNARAMKAEAEIARRDAAASEPFGWLRVTSGRAFQIMEGGQRPPDRSGECSGPWFAVYTVAQPVAVARDPVAWEVWHNGEPKVTSNRKLAEGYASEGLRVWPLVYAEEFRVVE